MAVSEKKSGVFQEIWPSLSVFAFSKHIFSRISWVYTVSACAPKGRGAEGLAAARRKNSIKNNYFNLNLFGVF